MAATAKRFPTVHCCVPDNVSKHALFKHREWASNVSLLLSLTFKRATLAKKQRVGLQRFSVVSRSTGLQRSVLSLTTCTSKRRLQTQRVGLQLAAPFKAFLHARRLQIQRVGPENTPILSAGFLFLSLQKLPWTPPTCLAPQRPMLREPFWLILFGSLRA